MADKSIVSNSKLDALANAIAEKSGGALPFSINEMITEVGNISGGGGASNIVVGEFTVPSAWQVTNVPIEYDGSGYPIVVAIWPKGAQNEAKQYTSIAPNAHVVFVAIKWLLDTPPSYTQEADNDKAFCVYAIKDRANYATDYKGEVYVGYPNYANKNASSGGAPMVMLIKNNKTLSVYGRKVSTTQNYGFLEGDYNYIIMYSS